MYVTKKHLPRRTFLRGAGVTLALPFLESLLPRSLAADTRPAWASTRCFTIASPRPVPPSSRERELSVR